MKRFPWKVALVLWIAGTLAGPLLLPYASAMMAAAPSGETLPASGATLVLLVLLRSLIMIGVSVGVGLPLARSLGRGAPLVEAWVAGRRPEPGAGSIVVPAVTWAAVTAAIAIGVDLFFVRVLGVTIPAPEIHARLIGVAPWRGLLVAFGGGIYEELFYRLFLLTLVTWIFSWALRARTGSRLTVVFWAANLAVAVYFGYDHFHNESLWGPLTPLVQLRTVLIILPPGLAFGYLFWKRGIEAAALSHAAIILIIHVLRPWIERGWGG